jgi:hypothetical protein
VEHIENQEERQVHQDNADFIGQKCLHRQHPLTEVYFEQVVRRDSRFIALVISHGLR